MSENIVYKEKDQDNGQITYANEVIATIVSVATTEVEGISGISGSTGAISGIVARGKTPRGVKVDMDGKDVAVDVSVTVDYGMPIQKVGRNAQENVRKSIESMTGLHVEKVDLHVVGVSFEKENQEMQQSQKLAAVSIEDEHPVAEENAPITEIVADEAPVQDEADEEPVDHIEENAVEADETQADEEAEDETQA